MQDNPEDFVKANRRPAPNEPEPYSIDALLVGIEQPQQPQQPQPQELLGQPQETLGQPQETLGQPQETLGQPQETLGQPQQPQETLGQPQQPQELLGQPQETLGQPQETLGQPQETLGSYSNFNPYKNLYEKYNRISSDINIEIFNANIDPKIFPLSHTKAKTASKIEKLGEQKSTAEEVKLWASNASLASLDVNELANKIEQTSVGSKRKPSDTSSLLILTNNELDYLPREIEKAINTLDFENFENLTPLQLVALKEFFPDTYKRGALAAKDLRELDTKGENAVANSFSFYTAAVNMLEDDGKILNESSVGLIRNSIITWAEWLGGVKNIPFFIDDVKQNERAIYQGLRAQRIRGEAGVAQTQSELKALKPVVGSLYENIDALRIKFRALTLHSISTLEARIVSVGSEAANFIFSPKILELKKVLDLMDNPDEFSSFTRQSAEE